MFAEEIIKVDIWRNYRYNILDFGVWRSLVSRLVRVQEASGSNPDTPTNKKPSFVFLTREGFIVAIYVCRR